MWISLRVRNRAEFMSSLGVWELKWRIRWRGEERWGWKRECGERQLDLRGGIEISCSQNFLKYMKTILMKSPNNEGYRVPTVYFLSPNEASNSKTGLHWLELLVKGVSWISPNNAGCCQDNRLLSANWYQGPLWKTIPKHLSEHREFKLVPIENLHSYVLVSSVKKGILQATKREMYTPTHPQNFWYVLPENVLG